MTATIIAFGIGAALGGVVFWLGHKVGFDKGHIEGYSKASKDFSRNGMSDLMGLAAMSSLFSNFNSFMPPAPSSKTEKK